MKKTNVRKICAWICTAALCVGTTANATPVMYEDYNDAKKFADTGWKTNYSAVNRDSETAEVCIEDGELVFPFSGWKKFTISKNVDSAQSTKNLIFEMTTEEIGALYNGGSDFNDYPYYITFEELDDSGDVIRSDEIGMNCYYYGFAVNGKKLGADYSAANHQLFYNNGKATDIRIIFDCENGKIYPQMRLEGNAEYKNIYNSAWETATENVMNAYKYDRIKIRVIEGTQTVSFDNIKMYDEEAPETPYLDDDFDVEGLSFGATGWKISGANYIKSVSGGKVYYEYLKNTADYMPLSHDIPAVAEGIQVIDMDFDMLNNNGERDKAKNGDPRTMMLTYSNGSSNTLLFSLDLRAKVGDSKYGLGVKPDTVVSSTDWTEWRKIGDALSLRFVINYNTKMIDLYYKSGSGVYTKAVSVNAASVLVEGVCANKFATLLYNSGAHSETTPDVIRIDNFKSYYIDEENEVSKPVFVNKTTGAEITSLVPGTEGYVTTSVLNKGVLEKPVSLIVGIFDSQDKFVGCSEKNYVSNITLSEDAPSYDLFVVPFAVPSELEEGSYIKLFAWNDFNEMIPYTEAVELK